MSIQSPVGTLDIKNATLRVGKLEVSNIQGVDTALNVTRANSVLIYDDQASTTTFSENVYAPNLVTWNDSTGSSKIQAVFFRINSWSFPNSPRVRSRVPRRPSRITEFIKSPHPPGPRKMHSISPG